MGKLERFDIELNNPEEAYFAGQEISGKIIIEVPEPKKVNEILLELKGRARTYWTKHSGKSRKHCSHSEPYFLEQFNTAYTHKFTVTRDGKEKERILPAGVHEVPFSYTLPKSLPTSFEGEFGHIRYTCRALSTTGYTVKRSADVVKRSRKAIMNFLSRQEEYGTKESTSNRTTSIVGIRRTCGIDASKTTVWGILDKCPNIVRSRMKKCPQLTQGDKHERLRWARIFMGCDWGKTQLLRVFKNKPIN
uniref:Arrestin_N domain-containing protein n=1 Tax=Heterorhabditis bacteriophora TaxID=37862 RepID=A0A1I7WSV5_HETBA